jgi:hypothetical protein
MLAIICLFAVRQALTEKIRLLAVHKSRIKLRIIFRKFEDAGSGNPSLGKLMVLLTVVEESSFTGENVDELIPRDANKAH